jgi:two-component system, LytTR family, sensor histidine kinase AlgZ
LTETRQDPAEASAPATQASTPASTLAPRAPVLPDACNYGIALRLLLAINAVMLVATLPGSPSPQAWMESFVERAAVLEPAALASMLLSCSLRKLAAREARWLQWVTLALIVTCPAVLAHVVVMTMSQRELSSWDLLGVIVSALALGASASLALQWRSAQRQPALVAARVAALSARIRPHFFFNALNATLGVIRSQPRVAESMIEDLAELFRGLATGDAVVPLADEALLARRYLAVEQQRLGERLTVNWQQAPGLDDVLVPQLTLQPLVENAVRHGVEPAARPEPIDVSVQADGRVLVIRVENALPPADQTGPVHAASRPGSQTALTNIRERLMLLHDLEASLETRAARGRFVAELRLPLVRRRAG